MKPIFFFLPALATACASAAPRANDEALDSSRTQCDALPLFALYEKNGAISRQADGRVALHLPIDLHEVDCGAPDCFGHDMRMTLTLGVEAGRCVIVTAEATSTAFDRCEDPARVSKGTPWQNSFTVEGKPDLSDPALARIELRDAARGHALVLGPITYYFYEKVTPEKKLLARLRDSENPECCGGYTYRKALDWSEPSAP